MFVVNSELVLLWLFLGFLGRDFTRSELDTHLTRRLAADDPPQAGITGI